MIFVGYDFIQRFQALEVNRITFTRDMIGSSVVLEGRLPPKIKGGCDRIQTVRSTCL